jgi:putative OmpL-like beta-barrel porin-2
MQGTTLRIAGFVTAWMVPLNGWVYGIEDRSQLEAFYRAPFADAANVTLTGCDLACNAAVEDVCCGDSCSDPCCGESCDCGGCPWLAKDLFKLPQPCVLQALGINTGGWLQVGVTGNAENPGDNFNGPLLTNDRVGDPQMNEMWLYFHKPVDTGGCGFDIGGRLDLLYGTDWRAAYFHGLGLEGDLNGAELSGSNELYGFAVPQFYAEIGLNNLSVKIGRMTGILGYEIIPPMGNFFYSHSYSLCYGEPFLITGLMGNYKISDQLNVLAGIHQGIHRFEDNNDRKNFQGGVMWNSKNQRLSLAYALDVGQNDFLFPLEEEYVHSLVGKLQLTPELLYVMQNDYGWANGTAGNPDAEWYSINQYLLYTINEKWSAGVRAEWFRDDDGTRVLGLGNLDARGWSAPSGLPGYNGSFTNLTMGLNWKPKANLLIRPEMRWDWSDGSTNAANLLPFDAGNSDSQFTFAADLVLMF